jgi:adenylate cyclase
MVDREPEVPDERWIRFRIGINLGDVIVEEHDLFGDGVNVAARLEGLAEPGGICVSGTVRDHIGDRLPYAFEDIGEQSVKNIARPVRAYHVRDRATELAGAAPPFTTSISQPKRHGCRSSSCPLPILATIPINNTSPTASLRI